MSDKEFYEFVRNGLCAINRISIILSKVIIQQELTKNEKIIVKEVIKMKGLDEA